MLYYIYNIPLNTSQPAWLWVMPPQQSCPFFVTPTACPVHAGPLVLPFFQQYLVAPSCCGSFFAGCPSDLVGVDVG